MSDRQVVPNKIEMERNSWTCIGVKLKIEASEQGDSQAVMFPRRIVVDAMDETDEKAIAVSSSVSQAIHLSMGQKIDEGRHRCPFQCFSSHQLVDGRFQACLSTCQPADSKVEALMQKWIGTHAVTAESIIGSLLM